MAVAFAFAGIQGTIDDLLRGANGANHSGVPPSTPAVRVLPLVVFVVAATATPRGLAAADAPPGDPPPPGAIPAPAFDDTALLAHARDVVDYVLRATLDPDTHTIHGEGTITWRNTSNQPVNELWLHLYLNAFKNERSTFLRERVGGRGSVRPDDWGWIDVQKLSWRGAGRDPLDLWKKAETSRPGDADETDARVPLPAPVGPGGEVVLDVAFDDKLPAVVERTGYGGRFHMVGQWFPKVARLEPNGVWAHFPFHHLAEFYADFGTYDVTLDVPEAFTIGATGPAIESRVAGGRRIERHVQGDVHDFAWTAWDAFRTRRERIDGVDVVVLHPPGYGQLAERELAALRFALPHHAARYGPYPYEVLTVVHPPQEAAEAGGMEYPTLITADGPWWTPPGVRGPEIVTVHELGHQWFYGLVATDELTFPMLDEGLNQFAEVDAMGRWLGAGSLVDLAGLQVSDAAVQAVGGNSSVHDEPVGQAADAFSSGANYGRLVYARKAAIVATLARVYGEDAVARALGRYTRRNRFRHPVPDDLLAAFEEVLGAHAAATLRTALFDKGWVDYAVEEPRSERARGPAGVFDRDGRRYRVDAGKATEQDGWESSVVLRRRGTLSFPVDVELTFADGSRRRERWDGGEDWKRLSFRGPVALQAVTVDPDDRVLVDANLADNSAVVDRKPSAFPTVRTATWAPRVLERATYGMQLALQVVSP
jgi:hypothetical protein